MLINKGSKLEGNKINNLNNFSARKLSQPFTIKPDGSVTVAIILLFVLLFSDICAQKTWYFNAQTPFLNVRSISAVDSFCVYAVSQDGLYKTTDGGSRWTRLLSDTDLESVRFHSRNEGIVQEYGLLRATTNGGVSWSNVSSTYFTAQIRFQDSLSGICSQTNYEYQSLLGKTTNGGITWSWISGGYGGVMEFLDQIDGTIWASGCYFYGPGPGPMLGAIVRYSTNYGVTWIIQSSSIHHANYTDLIMMRPSTVIVAVDNNYLKISTNGGSAFYNYPKSHGVYSLRSFGDSLLFAGADSGNIAVSHDYGVTFKLQKMNTDSPIKSLEIMKNGEGFAFSADGNFYSTNKMKVIPVDVDEVPGELPAEFSLTPNYPNPFNPSTVVRFALPVAGYVKGVVYDILGKEVATLLNGELPAGNHEVKFDGKGLTSGVYIFRITTGGKSRAIKMLLDK